MKKKQNIEHTQLLVLSLLSGEDMYSYQMIVELARRSDHTFEMKEGTLYPVLHGLEKNGYVEAYQQEAPTGRMRKYYHLTRKGGAMLKKIASQARVECEEFLGTKVNLQCWVKVKDDWRDSDFLLNDFGFQQP